MDYTLLVAAHRKAPNHAIQHCPKTEDEFYASFAFTAWPITAFAKLRTILSVVWDTTSSFKSMIAQTLVRRTSYTGL